MSGTKLVRNILDQNRFMDNTLCQRAFRMKFLLESCKIWLKYQHFYPNPGWSEWVDFVLLMKETSDGSALMWLSSRSQIGADGPSICSLSHRAHAKIPSGLRHGLLRTVCNLTEVDATTLDYARPSSTVYYLTTVVCATVVHFSVWLRLVRYLQTALFRSNDSLGAAILERKWPRVT